MSNIHFITLDILSGKQMDWIHNTHTCTWDWSMALVCLLVEPALLTLPDETVPVPLVNDGLLTPTVTCE